MKKGVDVIGVESKDFMTVIISHERVKTMKTLDSLKVAGFVGDYRIVIDSSDKQLSEYIEKYGERCIVFDKAEIAEQTDLMHNWKNWRVSTLPRNFVLKWAKENGYRYVFVIDDDIKCFNYCYEDIGKKIKRQPIKNINNVISALLEFLKCSDKIMGVGFVADGLFFGGKYGAFKRTYDRYVTQCLMLKTDVGLWYKGIMVEDFILSHNFFDKIALEYYRLSTISPATASNQDGGIYYDGDYEKSFYQVMFFPAGHKIIDCVERKYTEHIMPKVIREKHKKV